MPSPVNSSLLGHFSALKDPRQCAKVVYPLVEILLLVLSATSFRSRRRRRKLLARCPLDFRALLHGVVHAGMSPATAARVRGRVAYRPRLGPCR